MAIRPSASNVASTNRKKPWASTAIEMPRSGHSAPGASKASVIGPARANRATETGTAANALSRSASPSTAVTPARWWRRSARKRGVALVMPRSARKVDTVPIDMARAK